MTKISPVFKEVTKEKTAHLYTMSHTFATFKYGYTKDLKIVVKCLVHKYLNHIANSIKEQVGKRNLFKQDLRSITKRGKRGKNRLFIKKGLNH